MQLFISGGYKKNMVITINNMFKELLKNRLNKDLEIETTLQYLNCNYKRIWNEFFKMKKKVGLTAVKYRRYILTNPTNHES